MEDKNKKYETIETMHGTFTTTIPDVFRRRKPWQPKDPKKVLSFMPGSVVEFKVKPGAKVKEGDILLVFKAMKMNNLVRAEISGVVKSLGVETGVNVAKNTVLMEFE